MLPKLEYFLPGRAICSNYSDSFDLYVQLLTRIPAPSTLLPPLLHSVWFTPKAHPLKQCMFMRVISNHVYVFVI